MAELKQRKARVRHTCTACGKGIPKGHKYLSNSVKAEDGTYSSTIKEHTNCKLYRNSK